MDPPRTRFFVMQWLVNAQSAVRPRLAAPSHELAADIRADDGLHERPAERDHEDGCSVPEHQQLLDERDVALRQLAAVLGSTSWRVTAPLRRVTRGRPALSVRSLTRGHSTTRSALRRAKRLLSRLATLELSVRNGLHEVKETSAAAYSARAIAVNEGSRQFAGGTRGRLICMTHVVSYPPRAGNEYRIHHMLTWLVARGWDVLLLVYPLSEELITSSQLTEMASQYPNVIVCQPDGTLRYRLRDDGAMLTRLLGRHPRTFAPLLNEPQAKRPGASKLDDLMQMICPDVLIELLLHVATEFEPDALLAEYVFMTRPFALVPPGVLKIVDTIDLFSTKQTKVTQYGVDDVLALTPEQESELLNRADVLIAIQAAEADGLHKLAPARQVISVGVDFRLVEHVPPPASRPVILMVGSGNPLNLKGLNDFLRFAWPLVRNAIPEAELHVIGSVGSTLDPLWPGIRIRGRVEDLSSAYAEARVIINPAIAGTGLKIKTVEALCHLRPIVLWPAGADGLEPELRELCQVATDWFDFARKVIQLTGTLEGAQILIDRRPELTKQFASDSVYALLGATLDAACH
jgi:Glycosyl transferases group 1